MLLSNDVPLTAAATLPTENPINPISHAQVIEPAELGTITASKSA
jgi:hypothetical protein